MRIWYTFPSRIAATMLMLALGSAAPSGQAKRLEHETRHVDSFGPPITTTGQLLSSSDVVVVGRVNGSWSVPSSLFEIATRYQVFVADILKADSHVSKELALELEVGGGSKDNGDHIKVIEYEGSPQLTEQTTYLLFLKWSAELGCYVYSHGAEGVFQVSDENRIMPFGKSPLAKSKRRMSFAALKTEIESAK